METETDTIVDRIRRLANEMKALDYPAHLVHALDDVADTVAGYPLTVTQLAPVIRPELRLVRTHPDFTGHAS